jgi:hypothetical protein
MRAALRYAWHGSGRRYDAVSLQVIGGFLGGVLFWALGLKLPQEILDNPALSGVFAIVLGVISGVSFVFFLRLAYWPIHRRVEPYGGLRALVQAKLGNQMGPLLLMASGVVAFVVLFGAGAIWAVSKASERRAGASEQRPKVYLAHDIQRQLEGIDKFRDDLLAKTKQLSRVGVDLHTQITSAIQVKNAAICPSPQEIKDYTNKVEIVLNEVQALSTKYGDYEYFRAVTNFASYNPYEVVASGRNVAKELEAGPSILSTLFNNQYFVSFGRSTHDLATWANHWDTTFGNVRKEVLALPVISSK